MNILEKQYHGNVESIQIIQLASLFVSNINEPPSTCLAKYLKQVDHLTSFQHAAKLKIEALFTENPLRLQKMQYPSK